MPRLAAADVSVARAGHKAVYLPHAIAVGAESVVNRAYCLDGLHGRGYRYPQRRGGPPSVRMAVPEWLLPGWRVPHAWIALGDRLLVSTVHAPSILSELRGTPTFMVLCHPSSKHGRHARSRALRGRRNWAVVAVDDGGSGGEALKFDELQRTAVRPLLPQDDISADSVNAASGQRSTSCGQTWVRRRARASS